MSDEPPPPPVLDLRPALLAKRRAECEHRSVLIDGQDDVLECADCGMHVNPYTYIRRLADDDELQRSMFRELADNYTAAVAKFNEYAASLQAKLDHHRAEVNHLIDVKNRLWNERTPDGRPLGAVAARVRRRRTKLSP